MFLRTAAAAVTALALSTVAANALAVRAGFEDAAVATADDAAYGAYAIGFDINFFGITRSGLWVNTNGNVTLDAGLTTFTPFDLTTTNQEIIAPFFADVDTRNGGTSRTAPGP